jgi:hypothetical protein
MPGRILSTGNPAGMATTLLVYVELEVRVFGIGFPSAHVIKMKKSTYNQQPRFSHSFTHPLLYFFT